MSSTSIEEFSALKIPPGKRKRAVGDDDQTDSSRPPRSTRFWMTDGNIVLQTREMLFKVHKSVLSMQSTVFADMFAMPQPDDQPTEDGCPIVIVDDTAQDWRLMLQVLYNTSSFCFIGSNVIYINVLLAMLRLGRKYEFERFMNEALQQLRDMYPTSLGALDLVLDRARKQNLREHLLFDAISGQEFKLLRCVVDLQINTILPMAYFFCIRNRSMAAIMSRRDHPDSIEQLSTDDVTKLVLGKESVLTRYFHRNMLWFHTAKVSTDCNSPDFCKAKIDTIRHLLHRLDTPIQLVIDPPLVAVSESLCSECRKDSTTAYNESRQSFLDDLPSIFGLPRWAELKDLL